MPTLVIEGIGRVPVDESFLKLSQEQQNAEVDKIVASSDALSGSPELGMVSKTNAIAGLPLGERLKGAAADLDKAVRVGANAMTFGLADRFAGGMDSLTGKAPSYEQGFKAQRAETDKVKRENPALATTAELAGGLVGGLGMLRSGATIAGRLASSGLLPRVLGYGAEGAAYGAAHGAGSTPYSETYDPYIENTKKGAAFGSMVGAGLPVAGSALGAGYRLGSSFVGPAVERMGRGASSLLRTAALADETGLRNLGSLGEGAMLPDAGPTFLGLAQGSGSGVGTGRSRLVEALTNRDRETSPRIQKMLDETLGPSPIPSQVESGLDESRRLVGQRYDPALRAASPVNVEPLATRLELSAENLRGPERQAVLSVRSALNDPGTDQLATHPRALHAVREMIDGMMNDTQNKSVLRQLKIARDEVDAELAKNVPGIKKIDAQYSELHRQSDALKRGSELFDTGKSAIRPSELVDEINSGAVSGVGPSGAPIRLRQGARAEIDRLIGTQSNDLNALERKLGTPSDWNAQKLGVLFGDAQRDRVVQALMSNRQFRDTYQKVVQGSQTAQRTSATRSMEGPEGGVVPIDTTLTGLGFKALNLVYKVLSGASTAKTKDEIGNVLASEGPEVQRIAQKLLDSAKTSANNSQAIRDLISSPRWIGLSTGVDANRK